MQLIFGEVSRTRLASTIEHFDLQRPRFDRLRALLATAQITILVFTPYPALMQSGVGLEGGPICTGVRVASTYCLGRGLPDWVVTSLMIAVLVTVCFGLVPVATAPLHAWTAFSIASSITLPDGGDQAAAVCTLLLIVVSFGDCRSSVGAPSRRAAKWRREVALAGLFVMRVQVSAIYFSSSVAKLFQADWMNGTAEYYVARDPYFGASGAIGNVLHLLTANVFVAVSASWGAIICEIVIAVLILCGPQSRGIAFVLCCALHGAIILTIGLWSFGLVMVGIVGLASTPYTERERRQQSWSGLSAVRRSVKRAERRPLDGRNDRECVAK